MSSSRSTSLSMRWYSLLPSSSPLSPMQSSSDPSSSCWSATRTDTIHWCRHVYASGIRIHRQSNSRLLYQTTWAASWLVTKMRIVDHTIGQLYYSSPRPQNNPRLLPWPLECCPCSSQSSSGHYCQIPNGVFSFSIQSNILPGSA
jgi:hypothetical protein